MKICAVVAAYNEGQTIGEVTRALRKKVHEIIVVDDGSDDKTDEIAKSQGAKVVRHFLNRGQGASLKTGIEYALENGADIIITFDGDGQHDANDIDVICEPIRNGEAEVVLGSRFLKPEIQIPFSRFFLLKAAVFFTRVTTGLRVSDTHNGFRAFNRFAAENIQIHQNGMAHASEILEEVSKRNLRYKEAPVTICYTRYSRKKGQRLSNSFRILWDLLVGKISR